jgi:hypothetical protein
MSGDINCAFCRTDLKLAPYVDHIRRDCEKLSLVEKNRAQDAVKKLLCECRGCHDYVHVYKYEYHREAQDHPHTKENWHIIEPQLSCFCPFVSGCVIPFTKYRHHALKECGGYINFIAAHCQPPPDWPHAEIERLKYWLRLLKIRRQLGSTPDESESGDSGPSIWVRFVSGGLCNGR